MGSVAPQAYVRQVTNAAERVLPFIPSWLKITLRYEGSTQLRNQASCGWGSRRARRLVGMAEVGNGIISSMTLPLFIVHIIHPAV
ncbi:hypothetical protein BO78DRAFT_394304 [Aspergillus sclerotiicarbonarius CBS 121057]|uniref:Uncharacterized protein n=1 Tax=Aspergillus sclerotiicarbonarius (strain CBS 121057 / IBT 28362) TaxID=1448318 RepID=A0A319EYR3_ASPSB|nr:hypothetical protein BO78DRAFT_394304 [Aspergillus sclerotiicarbonarius CBS 121057]